jgi:uncharacterized protein
MAYLAMSASTVAFAVLLGVAAGVLAGLFGVGGGILFVPTLVALGLGQVEAQATSLLAILPTVLAGTWNQRRYGNLRARTAAVVGLASILGVELGARIATSLSEESLRRLFAILLFGVAVQLAWRARRATRRYADSS